MSSENNRKSSQQNYISQKQRQEEKRKIQEAIFLSKREEAKQIKFQTSQNRQRRNHIDQEIANEAARKNQMVN